MGNINLVEGYLGFQDWQNRAMYDPALRSRYETEHARMDAYWRTICMDTVQQLNRYVANAGQTMTVSHREKTYKRAPGDYVETCNEQWKGGRGGFG